MDSIKLSSKGQVIIPKHIRSFNVFWACPYVVPSSGGQSVGQR